MQVISFFENLFKSFGNILGFLDTKITLPNLSTGGIQFPSANEGWKIIMPSSITLSVWQLLSTSIGVALVFLLALHVWHLVKPIG